MQITYDTKANAMYLKFKDGEFGRNKEIEERIIVDFAKDGSILGIEILEASAKFKPDDLARVDIRMPLNLASLAAVK